MADGRLRKERAGRNVKEGQREDGRKAENNKEGWLEGRKETCEGGPKRKKEKWKEGLKDKHEKMKGRTGGK